MGYCNGSLSFIAFSYLFTFCGSYFVWKVLSHPEKNRDYFRISSSAAAFIYYLIERKILASVLDNAQRVHHSVRMPVSRNVLAQVNQAWYKVLCGSKFSQISFEVFKRKKRVSRFNETNTERIYPGLRDKNKIFATETSSRRIYQRLENAR